ncbi:MAG: FMN-binding protein [Lachnospiraceae bacterium]|nr:FMN-binding protein [Lachnospiraceae bacterium]
MRELKSGNGQTETGRGEHRPEDGKKCKAISGLTPLINLWPAVLAAVLIIGALPVTEPVLREVPDLLTINAEASETPAAEEVEEEDSAQGDFEDGIYTGTGTGYGGAITVEVTVENRNIVSVEIISAPGETPSFMKRAKAVIDSVISLQSWDVDVVSGATYSSKGILAAIQNALTGEKVETETAPVQETVPIVEELFEDPEGYTDGTYYGSARGFGGTIKVKVVISGGKIADIAIVNASQETPSYLSSAKAVISRMLAAQSPNVDTVSGATYSSNGIMNAVKIALKQAAGSGVSEDLDVDEDSGNMNAGGTGTPAGSSSSPQVKPPVIINPDEGGYVDGVYTGTAEGFGGDITVQVTIRDGKILSIEILNAEDETPSYLKHAENVIERMLAAQSTEVDVVSGATWSSAGIINAVSEALSKAISTENGSSGSESTEKPDSDSSQQPGRDTENSGSDSSEESGEEKPDESGSGFEEEANTTLYKDGVYQASTICADEDIFLYTVQVTAVIEEGKIADLQVEKMDDMSDDPGDNDVYLDYAINGRTRKNIWYEGVVKQILTTQNAEEIDVVSSATYSSNAIIAAAQEALQTALAEIPEESEATEGTETPKESEATEGTKSAEETETSEESEAAEGIETSEEFILRRFRA